MTRFTPAVNTRPAPFGTTDRRYDLRMPVWHVVYVLDGVLVFAILRPGPNESPKTMLAAIGVDITTDALVQYMG